MIVQLFWKGSDWIDAQNLWRRWMRAHNSPKPSGKDVTPILAASSAGFGGPNYSIELDNENDQNLLIRKYADERLKLNYWWMDIYNSSTNFWMSDPIYGGSGQYLAGSWDADRKNYPNGLRGVSDYAHSKGMGLIVWYEPEHVWPGYQFFKEHPEWLLSAPSDSASQKAINQGMPVGHRRVLNLGNPAAVNWLVENFSQTIRKEQISVYRQDFNIEPLVFWRNSEPSIARELPRTCMSRAICDSGMGCWNTILLCSSTPAPVEGVAMISKPCAGRSRSGGVTTAEIPQSSKPTPTGWLCGSLISALASGAPTPTLFAACSDLP